MKTSITYKGTKDGIFGIYCGFKPEGLEVEEEITIYRPDENKVFIKDGKQYSAVILQNGEKIEDYKEVERDNDRADT